MRCTEHNRQSRIEDEDMQKKWVTNGGVGEARTREHEGEQEKK